jgi:RimJ/RimL family protein N-acetyltransferase
MSFFLLQLSREQIADIAQSRMPAGIISSIEEDALPPQFIASRSLAQLADGKPDYWCCTFLICRIADNCVVGACGFKNEPTAGRVEIGYGVSPVCRKQGAATEAVSALLKLAYAGGAIEVLAEINPENPASTKVVRRLGFINTGIRVDEENETVVLWVASNDPSKHAPAITI